MANEFWFRWQGRDHGVALSRLLDGKGRVTAKFENPEVAIAFMRGRNNVPASVRLDHRSGSRSVTIPIPADLNDGHMIPRFVRSIFS